MEFTAEDGAPALEVTAQRLAEQELLVAEILLELPELIRQCESRKPRSSALELRWGAKRKRIERSRRLIGALGPVPALALGPDEPGPSKAWTDASSPDTPLKLCYSGGSSVAKSGAVAVSKRTSIRRMTEELRLAESVAQRERECLEGEIKMLRRRIECEKSLNIELKQTQKLLIGGPVNERSQWEKVNASLTLGVVSSPSAADVMYHRFGILDVSEPLVPNRTAPGADENSNLVAKGRAVPSLKPGAALLSLSLSLDPPPHPFSNPSATPVENGVGMAANSGRLDHAALDSSSWSRAAAAAAAAARARQRRYLINKAKLRR